MADEQVTAALSDMSLSELPPKLPNFPLPRELRDQIYAYLLDGEYVRTKRTWSQKEHDDDHGNDRTGPAAYHFHTNILGVNRAINEEAEELMYKRNMFVVLSYEYSGLGNTIGGLCWLRIVSNKHATRMKQHSVHIHVSPGTAGYTAPPGMGMRGNAPMQSAIFLARDLEILCLIMTTAGMSCRRNSLVAFVLRDWTGVTAIHGLELLDPTKLSAPQFECELRNTKYRQTDAATQRQILAPMARVLAPSQRVSFKGIVCDFREVEHMKQVMSPTLVCYSAWKWGFFGTLSLAKDVADAAFPHDDIKSVMRLYHMISITLAACTYTLEEDQMQRRNFLATCPEAVEACDILALEALVNAACCAVKARDSKILHEAGIAINVWMHRRVVENRSLELLPPQLKALCHNAMLWAVLDGGADPEMGTVSEAVLDLMVMGPGRERHQDHDIEILLRHPDQEALLTSEHLPLDQCSAFQLPLPNTSYHKDLLEPQKERYKGWLDMDLIRSLNEDMKQNVNNQQKHWKIKVTDFDELLQ